VRYSYLDAPVPLAFAHRGGAAAGDENTTAAFARAVALGYRYLETDVHATADGVAVVLHDATLTRTVGRPEAVAQLRYADLATIRTGGEPAVPRLDDVLAAWPQVRFNIDVKADAAVGPVAAVVRAAGALPRVLLASFADARVARLRRELGPALATAPGRRGVAALWAASRLGYGAARTASVLAAAQVPVRVADRRFVAHAHRLGLAVHVWTVDEPATIAHFLDLGVDGIMTDHIEVLREVYAGRGLWPGPAPQEGRSA